MWQDRAQATLDGVYHFGMDGGAAHGTPSGEGAASIKSAPESATQHHHCLDNQLRDQMFTSDTALIPQTFGYRAQQALGGYLQDGWGASAPSTRVSLAQGSYDGGAPSTRD